MGGKELYGIGGGPNSPNAAAIWVAGDGGWVGRSMSSASPVKYGQRMKVPICAVNCSNMYDYGPYSFHPSLAESVLCDGSVMTLHESIDPAVLAGLYTYQEAQLIAEH